MCVLRVPGVLVVLTRLGLFVQLGTHLRQEPSFRHWVLVSLRDSQTWGALFHLFRVHRSWLPLHSRQLGSMLE